MRYVNSHSSFYQKASNTKITFNRLVSDFKIYDLDGYSVIVRNNAEYSWTIVDDDKIQLEAYKCLLKDKIATLFEEVLKPIIDEIGYLRCMERHIVLYNTELIQFGQSGNTPTHNTMKLLEETV